MIRSADGETVGHPAQYESSEEAVAMLVAGVDVSERRGQTVALLDGATMTASIETIRHSDRDGEIGAIAQLVRARDARVVAIDSPLAPSRMLLRDDATRRAWGVPARRGMAGPVYANYRVCDFELIRRGLPLYQVAATREAAKGWMRVGFDLAAALLAAGYRLPRHADDRDATLIEVFPDAAFVTLLGGRPARKSTQTGLAQRRLALAAEGIHLTGDATHDDVDAVAAALTALRWAEGRGCAVGDLDEGVIALPVPRARLLDRYQRIESAP